MSKSSLKIKTLWDKYEKHTVIISSLSLKSIMRSIREIKGIDSCFDVDTDYHIYLTHSKKKPKGLKKEIIKLYESIMN